MPSGSETLPGELTAGEIVDERDDASAARRASAASFADPNRFAGSCWKARWNQPSTSADSPGRSELAAL